MEPVMIWVFVLAAVRGFRGMVLRMLIVSCFRGTFSCLHPSPAFPGRRTLVRIECHVSAGFGPTPPRRLQPRQRRARTSQRPAAVTAQAHIPLRNSLAFLDIGRFGHLFRWNDLSLEIRLHGSLVYGPLSQSPKPQTWRASGN